MNKIRAGVKQLLEIIGMARAILHHTYNPTLIGTHYANYRRDTEKAKKDSFMWTHTMEKHGEVRGPEWNNGLHSQGPGIIQGPYVKASRGTEDQRRPGRPQD